MAFNAGYCHNHLETIGVAQAPGPAGPYTLRTVNPIFPDGAHSCEDPFLWVDQYGWHLLAHNFGKEISLYAYSVDGYNFTISPDAPYTSTVQLVGNRTTNCNVQRPQLLFNDQGQPIVLTNGAQCEETGAFQWTMMRTVVP